MEEAVTNQTDLAHYLTAIRAEVGILERRERTIGLSPWQRWFLTKLRERIADMRQLLGGGT